MNLQSFQRVERLSDAAWTLLRFCLTVGPAMSFGICVASTFPSPGELMLTNAMESPNPVLLVREAVMIGLGAIGIVFFVLLQCGARSPLHQLSMQTWLAIHGWDGSTIRSAYRTSVPITEWICLIGTTAFCVDFAPKYFVLIPLAWAMMRLSLVIVRLERISIPLYATAMMIAGVSLLFMDWWWISLPSVLLIIAFTFQIEIVAQKQVADELMMKDLTFDAPVHSSRSTRTTTYVHQRVFPFYQLRPGIVDWRMNWKHASLFSTVVTWLTYCLLVRVGETFGACGPESQPNGVQTHADSAFAAIMMMAGAVGVIRFFQGISASWLPRLGPISRMVTMRPIVPSWDQILKPMLLAGALSLVICLWPGESWFVKFLLAEFLLLLILLRSGPGDEEFQMTADARLSSWCMAQK